MPEPRVGFLIGGVQKGGTTALARYLCLHPGIALPECKEAHVFDAPDFDESWTPVKVDARFAPHFAGVTEGRLCGDATPLTMFHPTLVARVARYNPTMRWVLLLRDPVERAISHYFMEHSRGTEPRSLLMALMAEPWRLRGHRDDWANDSPLRAWSYVARGRYVRQLDTLFAQFPRGQVLLLRSQDLATATDAILGTVVDFLGLPPMPRPLDLPRVFEGGYPPPPRLSPTRLFLHAALRGEVEALRDKYGVDLRG